MVYTSYGIQYTITDYNPYMSGSSTNTGYKVPTYNANNTNGETQLLI